MGPSPDSNRLPYDILKSITLNFITGYALLHKLTKVYGKNHKTEIHEEVSVKARLSFSAVIHTCFYSDICQ